MRFVLNAALTLAAVGLLSGASNLYDASLRDPRFFDGWMLAGVMAIQLLFHLRKKLPQLSLGPAARWLRAHIYVGYFAVGAFALHTDFSLPDTLFESILWALFVVVALSGAVGAYLSWSLPAKLASDGEEFSIESIPARRFALARQVEDLVSQTTQQPGAAAISEIYADTLHSFLHRPRNLIAHLRGSQRPVQSLCGEIENLQRYVDEDASMALRSIRERVEAKNRLDFQYAHQGLLQAWLFVHIPATYCLVVLSLLHIVVVYAFSTGAP